MADNIIETFDLTKIYKLKGSKRTILALNKVNLGIKKGEIFGLLGPNGAGKTTMISILSTLLHPTSGYATIDGFNILKKNRQAKSRISLMLESSMLYYRITGYQNLKFFCKIYKVPNFQEKIRTMVNDFDLSKWLNQYVENYSSGMKMKLALFRTFLLDRDIVFMDEPTLGLDVKSVNFVANKIKAMNKTIFLTSHDMNVVEKLCDRIAFIDEGKIVKVGTKEDLKRLEQTEVKIKILIKNSFNKLKSELNQQNYVLNIVDMKDGFEISLKERAYYNDLLKILINYDILMVKEQELTIEDLFLKMF